MSQERIESLKICTWQVMCIVVANCLMLASTRAVSAGSELPDAKGTIDYINARLESCFQYNKSTKLLLSHYSQNRFSLRGDHLMFTSTEDGAFHESPEQWWKVLVPTATDLGSVKVYMWQFDEPHLENNCGRIEIDCATSQECTTAGRSRVVYEVGFRDGEESVPSLRRAFRHLLKSLGATEERDPFK